MVAHGFGGGGKAYQGIDNSEAGRLVSPRWEGFSECLSSILFSVNNPKR